MEASDSFKSGELEKALQLYEQCAFLLKQTTDVQGVFTVLHEIAKVYETKNEYEKAIETLRKALEMAAEVGDKSEEAIASHRLGHVFYLKNEEEHAQECFNASMSQSADAGHHRCWALSRAMIGQIQIDRGMMHEGIGMMIDALVILTIDKAQEGQNLAEHIKSFGQRLGKEVLRKIALSRTDNKTVLKLLLRDRP
jgi:tetratricopeptide (TPR) repeat protein